MRAIIAEDYNKKRMEFRKDFLKLRDKIDKELSTGERLRSKEKRLLLYKMAKNNSKHIKKVGEREYLVEF